ncbi:MAG: HAD family hydrolase [Promethearchaeota archaeon]
MANILVTFDVDQTLLAGNELHQAAFSHGFAEVFGVDASITEVNHHGMTDPLLILAVMQRHGFAEEDVRPKIPLVAAAMTEYYEVHGAGEGEREVDDSRVLPGVRSLLSVLVEEGALVGLVTGNLEPIAWAKLERHGLGDFFPDRVGGFGSDHEDRAELVKLAVRRAEELARGRFEFTGDNAYHVGDAPSDLRAASEAGVRGIGVATGIYPVSDLEAVPHHAVLRDLTDAPKFLELVGLSGHKN